MSSYCAFRLRQAPKTGSYQPESRQEFRISKIAAGFYSTGDSSAWILSSEQFQNFLQAQAISRNLPLSLLQMLGTHKEVSAQRDLAVKRRLLAQILNLSKSFLALGLPLHTS